MKNNFLPFNILAVGLLLSCGSETKQANAIGENKEKENNVSTPNVIVILADDAGFADFGFQGKSDLKTPNIDLLAQSGVIFTDGHVSATVSGPSRAGLVTGRYQQRFGSESNIPPKHLGVDIAESTIGDAMKKAAYRTAIFGKWHLGEEDKYHPNNRGFDEFYGFLGGARSYFPSEKDDTPESDKSIMHNGEHVKFEGYFTDILGDKTCEFIESNKDTSFFIYLSFNAVHTPMHAKEEDMKMFEGHPRQTLAAMTWAMDRAVGNVTKTLKDNGLLENTVIFFLSDNGGAYNNKSINDPLKGGKGNKFEGGHRVPFFITWPNQIEAGQKNNALVSSLDILPTSVAATGAELSYNKPLDGVNLLPFIKGEKNTVPHETLFWRKAKMAAVRHHDWKLIRLEGFGYRLYNLKDDLQESKDLFTTNKKVAKELVNKLEKWEEGLIDPWWQEDEKWQEVTYHIHEYLMDNKEPVAKNPKQLKKLKNKKL